MFYINSYFSVALSKILAHSKTTKNAKKLLVFVENNSRRLCDSLFFGTLIIFLESAKINYRNIWFPKIIILIMTAQVLFFNDFSEKDPYLNAVEKELTLIKRVCQKNAIFVTIGVLNILVLSMNRIFAMVAMI